MHVNSICNSCENIEELIITRDELGWDDTNKEYIPCITNIKINYIRCKYVQTVFINSTSIITNCSKYIKKDEEFIIKIGDNL